MITALCGGVGGSKLVSGLYHLLEPGELSVIVNTADDLEFCGLRVCPDLDTVTYALAGIEGQHGWGIRDDTFHTLESLAAFGVPSWFRIGDRDMATHLFRTVELRRGRTLTEVASKIVESLGVHANVLPMTDDIVETEVQVGGQWIGFQEYFVHRQHRDSVDGVRYQGVGSAVITDQVRAAITDAEAIVIANSNPLLSILPILALPGFRQTLERTRVPVVAVSPFIAGEAVSGPAGDLMALAGYSASAEGLAGLYGGVANGMVIDRRDADQVPELQGAGLSVRVCDTLMKDAADRVALARDVVRACGVRA